MITYQAELIDVRVFAQVLGQRSIWHPRVDKGKRRGIRTESTETDNIRMPHSSPHNCVSAQSLQEPNRHQHQRETLWSFSVAYLLKGTEIPDAVGIDRLHGHQFSAH